MIGWATSCTDVDITMPKGPKGDTGLSAYEFWKEKVTDGTIDWPKNEVEVTDFFKYLKGKDGKNGVDGKSAYEVWKEQIATGNVDDPHNPGNKWEPNKNTISDFWKFLTGATGENGQTPHIGDNGNWWIGDVDTNVPARGKDGKPGEPGKDAEPPVVTIGANGNWFIDGVDTGKPSKGEDGKDGKTPTVTIGANNNWFIDGKDTGKPAVGKDGKSPEVAIGENGNWWIDGKDTGKPAYGKKGDNGKSAYELWKEEVAAGYAGTGPKVKDPKNPTEDWPQDKVSQADFWEFLRGADGKSAYEIWKEKVLDGTIDWPKNEVEVTDFFKYLKGKDGKNGVDGKSAYEVWKEQIATGNVDDPHNPGNKWEPNKNTISDFWKFLTGATGENGQTPHIGDNGNWWIGDVDTNVPARGKDGKPGEPGKDAEPPVVTIGANGNWFIDGVDTGKPSKGEDGKDGKTPTVTIGANNNWFIDGKDTGKPAVGKDGKSPEVAIGENGNWWIDGKDTGKPAYGKDGKPGEDGKDGKSAYELWKEEIAKGNTPDPHNPGMMWDPDKNTVADFWEFLRGKDGKDGQDGQDGEPGISIEIGKANVLPVYYNGTLKEYVDPKDGSVIFQVFDKEGKKVAQGAKVKGLPGVKNQDKEYVTDKDGRFTVPATDLPNNEDISKRKGAPKLVLINDKPEDAAANTEVPNKILTRINAEMVYPRQMTTGLSYASMYDSHFVVVHYKYERCVDGVWGMYPTEYPEPELKVVKVKNVKADIEAADLETGDWSKWKVKNLYGSFVNAKKVVLIHRPIVLTEAEQNGEEMNYPSPNPGFTEVATLNKNLTKIKEYEWNKVKNYFSIQGSKYFYGETPIMPSPVHVPEIYPAPVTKTASLDMKPGITYMWGTLDKTSFKPFYLKYKKPATVGGIWEITQEEAKKLETFKNADGDSKKDGVNIRVLMTKKIGSGAGNTVQDRFCKSLNNDYQFYLDSTLPENYFATTIWVPDAKGKVTHGEVVDQMIAPDYVLYRVVPDFKLTKEGTPDKYYRKKVFKTTDKIEVEQKATPTDWPK